MISIQEVETVIALLASRKQWRSASDINSHTPSSAPRTVRAILCKLVELGIVDYVEVFPGRRYRLAGSAEECHVEYFHDIAVATEVLKGS